MKKVRRNIIALRKIRRISRRKMADDLSMSYYTLAKYETGQRNLDINNLRNIADYFDVPMDQIFSRREFADPEDLEERFGTLELGEKAFTYGALTDEERSFLMRLSQLDEKQTHVINMMLDQMISQNTEKEK